MKDRRDKTFFVGLEFFIKTSVSCKVGCGIMLTVSYAPNANLVYRKFFRKYETAQFPKSQDKLIMLRNLLSATLSRQGQPRLCLFCCRGNVGIVDILPESAIINGTGKISDMIWLSEVFSFV
jgi:hypothetical protein